MISCYEFDNIRETLEYKKYEILKQSCKSETLDRNCLLSLITNYFCNFLPVLENAVSL